MISVVPAPVPHHSPTPTPSSGRVTDAVAASFRVPDAQPLSNAVADTVAEPDSFALTDPATQPYPRPRPDSDSSPTPTPSPPVADAHAQPHPDSHGHTRPVPALQPYGPVFTALRGLPAAQVNGAWQLVLQRAGTRNAGGTLVCWEVVVRTK